MTAEQGARRRPDGSMSLLVDMSSAALDPAYAEVAARRAAGVQPEPRGARQRVLAALLVVGIGTGVAAAQVRRDAHQAKSLSAPLVDDVRARTRATDDLAAQAATLRAQVSQLRTQALGTGAEGRALAAQVALLELTTAAVGVRGPGVVVTLSNAPAVQDGSSDAPDGRIYDRDIQDVVNALWAAGAEAVAVNGQRVTARTAIRSAGESILADLRPLTAPYRLAAVGDVDRLEPAFVDSATARKFQTWTSLYGIGFDVTRSKRLRLPAASQPALLSARPAATSGGAP